MKRLIAVAGVVLLLAGCASAPTAGTIKAKAHNSAYFQIICQPVGKVTVCNNIPIPESWQFDLYASEDNHGWIDVSQSVFDSHNEGDFYDSEGDNR